MNLFTNEHEQEAIERIQKFAKLAQAMEFDVCVGFSGGKDSQVTYDLCKRAGIEFKTYYNVAFESSVTKRFIRENYLEVIWRQEYPYGFIENIYKGHKGLLPTVKMAYCCKDYKHNPLYVDKCSVVGVRKAESSKRKNRTALSIKNKTAIKKNKSLLNSHFRENCQSIGTASVIQLLPIVDWSDVEVWDYIKRHNLPINPEYKKQHRVGCIVCPKANFTSNAIALVEHPRLIDAFIRARIKGEGEIDWIITSDNKDYVNDKPYYICRWLNHSFIPFSAKQEVLYKQVREQYDLIHKNKI